MKISVSIILLVAATSCQHRDPYGEYGGNNTSQSEREIYERGYRDGAAASKESPDASEADPTGELPERRGRATPSVNVGVGYGGGRHGGWGGGFGIGTSFPFGRR